tara:strand:+ start:57 stop:881 length:825 start_codon:yes stop_codon:yes gene_type:complete
MKDINTSDKKINVSDIINYEFTKSPKENLYLKVKVNYDYDEGTKAFRKATPQIYNGGIVPNNLEDYMSSYNVKDIDNYYLNFESKFIKDDDTANNLRNQLLSLYKNRHNIITLNLPHKYLDLECGDVVEFENLIQGVTMFGLDYTQENVLNGQIITKYFIVEGVRKTVDSVQVKLFQHHQYDDNFIEQSYQPDFLYNIDDVVFEDEDEIESDIANNIVGDLNLDGRLDVLDIVMLVTSIINQFDFDTNILADFNNDGSVDVLDIVAAVQEIINE